MATPTDKQISGMAGEFLTAGKLFKLGLQAAVTLGNAKSVDILAYNPQNTKNYNVQVKTNREKNCFLISKENVFSEQIYVLISSIVITKFYGFKWYYPLLIIILFVV